MEQHECLAANPRIYGQLVGILGKYSKFAGAGDKASVRAAVADLAAANAAESTPTKPADEADTDF